MDDGVSRDAVRHVAALARLAVTDDAAQSLARDLTGILEHMAVLQDVDTSATRDDTPPAEGMRLREDRGGSVPLALPLSDIAPEMHEGFFTVPRVASHDDAERDP